MIAKSFIKYIVFYVFLTNTMQFIFYYFGFYNEVWQTSENYFFICTIKEFFNLGLPFYFTNPISILFETNFLSLIIFIIIKNVFSFNKIYDLDIIEEDSLLLVKN